MASNLIGQFSNIADRLELLNHTATFQSNNEKILFKIERTYYIDILNKQISNIFQIKVRNQGNTGVKCHSSLNNKGNTFFYAGVKATLTV